jgi:glycosyltransferase involved in cell wall biosynthesis
MRELLVSSQPIRLAAVVSHPIQYMVPLFQRLAQRPSEVDLTVFYLSDVGLRPAHAEQLGETFVWDMNLLEGYRSVFLRNVSPHPGAERPSAKINPGIVPALLRGDYDALYLHGYASTTEWIAFATARTLRLPILFHGDVVLDSHKQRPSWLRSRFRREFCKRIDAGLAMSGRAREFYRAFDVPDSHVFWAPLAVDNERWLREADALLPEREALRRSIGLDPHLPTILHVSQLRPIKRPMDLLEAYARLATPANLLIVGGGPLLEALQERSRVLALPRVHFAGPQNLSTLGRYYAMGDVFVLPSEHEVNPLVIREAMCFGLPIIASDRVQSAIDFIEEGRSGFTFPMGDVVALADRIDQIIKSPERTRELGTRAREIILPWNYDVTVAGILSALSRVTRKATA